MTVIVVTVAVLAAATLAGWLLTRRSGSIREIDSRPDRDTDADIAALGLSDTGPTVVHFSAPWCGPCDRVRRVIEQVCDDLGDVAHVEVDLDANPETARRYSVLSLPTTLIFDLDGRQRYRTSGVPSAADLRSALKPLLA
ncbi:thiol reductase thioredoxin [Mycobacterium mantenii]|uniref:Thiol reductase thioredoxin n=1 Tax=Mycobacterium mantenii TaxID=560555 RepID=A0A1X0G237_MYCNT|nr:thioredoxin family protein [Mycobacterium mantenii]MCV7245005.1 thioredoxin family protein [Mycobacterium mantenii]ORB08066.1 thiol reductase thioredoxin [Mycobacterium mantenii]BBY40832.1 thiol reductase thioredoxin [Mycobacterium mantenii]